MCVYVCVLCPQAETICPVTPLPPNPPHTHIVHNWEAERSLEPRLQQAGLKAAPELAKSNPRGSGTADRKPDRSRAETQVLGRTPIPGPHAEAKLYILYISTGDSRQNMFCSLGVIV